MANVYTVNNKRYSIQTIDGASQTSYLLTEQDHNKWLKFNTTPSSINLNLPEISNGFRCVVENIGELSINFVNAAGTSLATQQDPFSEDVFRTVECVYDAGPKEWRLQGFVGRNDISSLYDVNTGTNGPPSAGDVLTFNGNVWTTGVVPPYKPSPIIVSDTILQESDHAAVLPIDTTVLPVDVAINLGLPAGFYCRIVNVGTGNLTITGAGTLNTPTTLLNSPYQFADIFHGGLEQYYIVTNSGGGGTGGGSGGSVDLTYININSDGNGSSVAAQDGIGIGEEASVQAAAIDGLAIGRSSDVTGQGGIAIGTQSDSANFGVSVGFNADSLNQGVAIGYVANADANATALGWFARASGLNSAQIGNGEITTDETLQFGRVPIATTEHGIITHSGTSLPSDAIYPIPAGTLHLDTLADQLLFYTGSIWKQAAANPYISFDNNTFEVPPNASGDGTLIIGGSTTVSGSNFQTIIGASAAGTSTGNIAIGYDSSANGSYSIALGGQSQTDNSPQGIAIGFQSYVAATDCTAIGSGSNVSITGNNSVQLGAGTNSTANTLQFQSSVVAGSSGIIIKTTSGAPVAPAEIGTCNFDPNTNTLYIYNGTTWVSTVLT